MSPKLLSASLEDYLEAIYGIVQKKRAARAKDIAQKLGVNNSSVTGALRSLSQKKLINYAPYDLVTLTSKGEKVSKNILDRHTVLRDFFVKVLGVDMESADESACKMEHAVSKVIFERLTEFVEFIEICPRAGTMWILGFGYFCDNTGSLENCERCIAGCLESVREQRSQMRGQEEA